MKEEMHASNAMQCRVREDFSTHREHCTRQPERSKPKRKKAKDPI
jgi:hypothetical protein